MTRTPNHGQEHMSRPDPDAVDHQQWAVQEIVNGEPFRLVQRFRTEALCRAEVSDWPADRPYRIVVRTISAWRPAE